MVLEPGGGLSFPLPPGGSSSASGGSLLAPTRLFQRTTPVFPFHLAGWPPHHPVLGQVQSQVQQSMQAQHQAAAAAVRFLSHHHPHHPHPALGNHSLVPAITGHHPTAHHLHHTADHGEEDDEKKGKRVTRLKNRIDRPRGLTYRYSDNYDARCISRYYCSQLFENDTNVREISFQLVGDLLEIFSTRILDFSVRVCSKRQSGRGKKDTTLFVLFVPKVSRHAQIFAIWISDNYELKN